LDRDTAEKYVEKTLTAAEDTIKIVNNDDTIWVGPIQGGKYLDLVRYSAKRLNDLGYQMFALGSPTEVMEAYEFRVLAEMITAARESIPSNKPLHLFGAGNPLTIPLAVALGCDTFDSASYMLYAKDDRYMLPNRTVNIKDLSYLPCNCPVCSKYKPYELKEMDKKERILEIAKHNLYIIKMEVDAVKEAIVDGRLWEYIIQKSFAHPKLYAANYILSNINFNATPLYKEHAIFFFNAIDQYRPEAVRFRDMVKRVRYNEELLILIPEQEQHPLYTTSIYNKIKSMVNATIAYYSPFLSIVPEELSDIFPAAHHLSANLKFKVDDFPTFKESFNAFIKNNSFANIIILADDFMKDAIEELDIKCKIVESYEELLDIL
jgi:7-cyano-7-deazaguanine tRNA-ribosyltransferase